MVTGKNLFSISRTLFLLLAGIFAIPGSASHLHHETLYEFRIGGGSGGDCCMGVGTGVSGNYCVSWDDDNDYNGRFEVTTTYGRAWNNYSCFFAIYSSFDIFDTVVTYGQPDLNGHGVVQSCGEPN
jgi:hypothetical protein